MIQQCDVYVTTISSLTDSVVKPEPTSFGFVELLDEPLKKELPFPIEVLPLKSEER